MSAAWLRKDETMRLKIMAAVLSLSVVTPYLARGYQHSTPTRQASSASQINRGRRPWRGISGVASRVAAAAGVAIAACTVAGCRPTESGGLPRNNVLEADASLAKELVPLLQRDDVQAHQERRAAYDALMADPSNPGLQRQYQQARDRHLGVLNNLATRGAAAASFAANPAGQLQLGREFHRARLQRNVAAAQLDLHVAGRLHEVADEDWTAAGKVHGQGSQQHLDAAGAHQGVEEYRDAARTDLERNQRQLQELTQPGPADPGAATRPTTPGAP
jgi:hypothetical protein